MGTKVWLRRLRTM
jgi:hypothetical protein